MTINTLPVYHARTVDYEIVHRVMSALGEGFSLELVLPYKDGISVMGQSADHKPVHIYVWKLEPFDMDTSIKAALASNTKERHP